MSIYKTVNLDEVQAAINPSEDLAFDTETIGKYGHIKLAQFYQRHWKQALIVIDPPIFDLFLLLNNFNKTNIVMQYASYDISTIQTQTGSRWVPKTFSDTFLLARLAFPHLDKYSLDELIALVYDGDPYAEANIIKADMHKADWKFLDEQKLLYAAIDVYYLFYLYDKVKHCENSLSYKIDMRALRRALDFQCNGLAVDRDKLDAKLKQNLIDIDYEALPINANSYKQVRPYIGSDESDAKGLARLAMFGNEKAAQVRRVRSLLKQNSFIKKFDTEEGRIYGRFAPSTRSGRFSCSDQNLQQLPRALKGCFGVSEDKVLIFSDYAQLELRTIAAITGDVALCQFFYNKEDAHGIVAEKFFGPNWTKDNRQTTKTINFNALYGGGAPMLQQILLMQANQWHEVEAVRTMMRKWKRLFAGIAAWQENGIKEHKKGRLGSTPFGRQYKGRLMTDHLNIENQGFGADVAKLALHYMYDDLIATDAKLVNFVHDSYIIEMDNDESAYKTVCARLAEAMKDAWSEASKMARIKDIPMPVEVSVGFNWGEIESGKTIYSTEA
jgi:DNA polymerase I-like protein with 3'-5' exonuclease and polymerase domains